MQIETWSSAHPPLAIRPAPGFAAIVASDRLEAVMQHVLARGGCVLAALDGGEVVGYASVVRPEPIRWLDAVILRRWDELPGVLELAALEVARPFRSAGVVHHWDLGWSSLPPYIHRLALEATLRHAGMDVRETDEPEVRLHPANALFVRLGASAAPSVRAAFEARLWSAA